MIMKIKYFICYLILFLIKKSKNFKTFERQLYIISTKNWPQKWRDVPSIGNGHLATVVKRPWIQMSGFYNGRNENSHRAKIPSTNFVEIKNITVNNKDHITKFNITYVLDARTGIFSEKILLSKTRVKLEWFFHRTLSSISVFKIFVKNFNEFLFLQFNMKPNFISKDLKIKKMKCPYKNINCFKGIIKEPENSFHKKRKIIYIIYEDIPELNKFLFGFEERFYLSSIDFSFKKAINQYILGKRLIKLNIFEKCHVQAWRDVWENGRIETKNNFKIGRAAILSFYNFFISLPIHYRQKREDFVSLSPGGLSWGASKKSYQGHVFWDQELWMLPTLQVFHPHISLCLLDYRRKRLKSAMKISKDLRYKGAKFPWESAVTGFETSPSKKCGKNEIHINGDILLALSNFRDVQGFLDKKFDPLILSVGDFWMSRVTFNSSSNLYHINCVMPPDEYVNCVNNSIFTNKIAQISLALASEVAISYNQSKASIYKKVSENIFFPFDWKFQYHPEYDGYQRGQKVKQADVIMLIFPLLHPMIPLVANNNLLYYQNFTSTSGPAMGDAIFSIGWFSIGERIRGLKSFYNMFEFISGDFQIWSEEKNSSGCENFLTGMGGYLQSLVFGYLGVRYQGNKMFLKPQFMEKGEEMIFYNIKFNIFSFDIIIKNDIIIIKLRNNKNNNFKINNNNNNNINKIYYCYENETGKTQLIENEAKNFKLRPGFLYIDK